MRLRASLTTLRSFIETAGKGDEFLDFGANKNRRVIELFHRNVGSWRLCSSAALLEKRIDEGCYCRALCEHQQAAE